MFTLIKELIMAVDAKSYSIELLEKLWIQKALELQIRSIMRARGTEIAGSEIYVLRTKEIDLLNRLKEKFV